MTTKTILYRKLDSRTDPVYAITMNITADTYITWHNTAGDSGDQVTTVAEFEDELRACAEQTVDDCEQEIHEGGYFAASNDPDLPGLYESDEAADEARRKAYDDLYENLIAQASRCYREGRGVIKVEPWYAVNQRLTFKVVIRSVGGDG